MGNIVEINDSSFEAEVKKSDKLTIVDFWAEWCGPCKMITPILEEITGEYSDKVKVTKIDVDASQQIAGSLGITSIPTLVFYKDGNVVDKLVGLQPKDKIVAKIEENI